MPSSSKPGGFYSSNFWADYLTAQRSKLPVLSEVDDGLSGCVVRFLGGNPGDMQLQGTNTYLVGTGRTRILIDTGEGLPEWAVNVTRYLEDHDISISHILLTHWHGDHTGGVADLLAHDPEIVVHKHQPDHGQQTIENGQVFRTQGATIRAVLTPGHTTDHVCFVLEEENALFTGDNVLGHGYSVAQDLSSYTASLRVMASLRCSVGYPGHGAVIQNLPHKIAAYIAQRDSREQQVYAALVKHASSVESGHSVVGSRRNFANFRGYDSSSRSDSSVSSDDEEIDGDSLTTRGLSIVDISYLLYGEVTKDAATFESALEPLLNQVLVMLVDHGQATSMLLGADKTRYWFARESAHTEL